MSADLVAFLRARLAEDEAEAVAAGPDGGEWFARDSDGNLSYGEFGWWVSGPAVETEDSEWGQAVAVHISRHDPARVLREVEAGRALLEDHNMVHDGYPGSRNLVSDPEIQDGTYGGPCAVLLNLAAIYRDHEDYREEWAL